MPCAHCIAMLFIIWLKSVTCNLFSQYEFDMPVVSLPIPYFCSSMLLPLTKITRNRQRVKILLPKCVRSKSSMIHPSLFSSNFLHIFFCSSMQRSNWCLLSICKKTELAVVLLFYLIITKLPKLSSAFGMKRNILWDIFHYIHIRLHWAM